MYEAGDEAPLSPFMAGLRPELDPTKLLASLSRDRETAAQMLLGDREEND
jgi:hypothetical protein